MNKAAMERSFLKSCTAVGAVCTGVKQLASTLAVTILNRSAMLCERGWMCCIRSPCSQRDIGDSEMLVCGMVKVRERAGCTPMLSSRSLSTSPSHIAVSGTSEQPSNVAAVCSTLETVS